VSSVLPLLDILVGFVIPEEAPFVDDLKAVFEAGLKLLDLELGVCWDT